MKYSFITFATFVVMTLASFTSCIMEPEGLDYDDVEQEILGDWITQYVPEAKYWQVYDEDDEEYYEYYTLVEDEGDLTEMTIAEYGDCWVEYNLTGSSLDGKIYVTRDEIISYQEGTFDELARYVPIYQDMNYNEKEYYENDEYDYLPMCLKYAFSNEDLKLRKGSKLKMYIPSEIVDGAATAASAFQGQYSRNALQPLLADIEIVDVVADPEAKEIDDVVAFANANGGLLINYREYYGEDIEDEDYEEYNKAQELIPENWSNAVDTVADVYIYRRYTPEIHLNYTNPYTSSIPGTIYNTYTMDQIDSLIEIVVEDMEFSDPSMSGDYVEFGSSPYIWYIGRYLDGFIFDTNFGDLTEYITGNETADTDFPFVGTSSAEASDYIMAWFYSVPQLRHGQWATIITTSEHAYGEVTFSDDIQGYTPLVFHIYVEPSDVDL